VPRVIVTEGAAEGLEQCRRFLAESAPEAARRAGQAIARQLLLLETAPDIGRPFPEMPELRVPHPEHQIDKQIAAIALVYDLVLVTRNAGHFEATGVRLMNPFRGR